MLKRCFLMIIFVMLYCVSNAQQERDLKQDVKVGSVYKAKLKEAHRIAFLPNINDSLVKKPIFTYNILSKPGDNYFKPSPIGAAKMINAPLAYNTSHRLSLAVANYSSMLGDYVFNNKKSDQYNFGAHLRHYSSRGTISLNNELKSKSKPKWVGNYANIYATKYLLNSHVGANLYFENKSMNYYGYPRVEDVSSVSTNAFPYEKQNYRNLGFNFMYSSYETDKIKSDIELSYNRFADKYDVKEDDMALDISLSKTKEDHLLGVYLGVSYLNTKNVFENSSTSTLDKRKTVFLSLNPYYTFIDDVFSVRVGAKVIKTLSDEAGFYVYPDINAQYHVVVGLLSIIAGLDGDLHHNSYASISNENPYIVSGTSSITSKEKYHFYAGIKGNISSKTSYKTVVEYSAIDDAKFYDKSLLIDPRINIKGDLYSNKFKLVYDDVKLLDINAELNLKWNNKLDLNATAHYYKYKMDMLEKAWYKPHFKLNLQAKYSLMSELQVNAGMLIMGRRSASNIKDNSLKSIYDFHFGADYKLNKYISVYSKVNNLFAFKYYQWQAYPSQALNMWLGIRLSL